MKNGGERRMRPGEGWLVAAVLVCILALSLALCVRRVPPAAYMQPAHSVPADAVRRAGLVDINAADADVLGNMPGVGDVLAQRIVDYRKAHGPFLVPEDLMKVEGIGAGRFEALRDLVFCGGGLATAAEIG